MSQLPMDRGMLPLDPRTVSRGRRRIDVGLPDRDLLCLERDSAERHDVLNPRGGGGALDSRVREPWTRKIDNRYRAHTRPNKAQPLGFRYVETPGNQQMPFVPAHSRHSPRLPEDSKTTEAVSQDRIGEAADEMSAQAEARAAREDIRYARESMQQLREGLERRLGTPHSLAADAAGATSQAALSPAPTFPPTPAHPSAPGSVPRGQWSVPKELVLTGAATEMRGRAHAPIEPGTSPARRALWFRVQGDMKAEAMVQKRFEEDAALLEWRNEFKRSRHKLTREKFRRRREENRRAEEQARLCGADSLMPQLAGRDEGASPPPRRVRQRSPTRSARSGTYPHTNHDVSAARMTTFGNTADSDSLGFSRSGGAAFSERPLGQAAGAEREAPSLTASWLAREDDDALNASARVASSLAARPPEKNLLRSQFRTVNNEGQFVPHTAFHSVQNKPWTEWTAFDATPDKGLNRSSLDPLPADIPTASAFLATMNPV